MARLRATAPAAHRVLVRREHGGMLDRVGNRSTPSRPSKSAHASPSKIEIPLIARKIESADAIVLLQFGHQRPEIETARRKPMDHDDRGLCLITHADVEDLHWARLIFWQRGLPSEELAANLPLFGRVHYSVSQRCNSRRADPSATYLNHRMAQ